MNNRLKDLKKKAQGRADDLDEIALQDKYEHGDLERAEGGYSNGRLIPKESEFVSEFFSQVSEIKTRINKIDENATLMEKQYNSIIAEVKKEANTKAFKQKVTALSDDIDDDMRFVKRSLEEMAQTNRILEEHSAERRMRENQHASLTQLFFTVMQRFNGIQAACKQRYRDDLMRNLRNIYSEDEKSDEELNEMIESGQIQEGNLYGKFLLKNSTQNTIKSTYSEIKETHEDLKRLELSMSELQDMFRDLHSLLMMQQDLIDNIEDNVLRSVDYTEKGVNNIKTAKKVADKTRHAKCCLFVIVIVVAIVVILIVAGVIGISVPLSILK
ncbi:predicted protein [Naegleria gruberi]|uniref:Predicted protein n=1 Tax=Naegleria gruberi TaxID=5762 RepID=D2UY14_NAEGR|nr:uncharacterized protein NAEGRDRAFT_61311 [Naegleria gruberi]EFC50389.1 predicted protein [Naegleria gruberi]|eukprot:XP_002683133.1 predicted protein [Naegleria gruberi strain NEG-M]